MEKSEKGEVRARMKISLSVLPGLSFRWWLSIELWMSQAGRDPGRDLCVRWEKELCIISITVVWHAMSRNGRTKEPSVPREEEGTEDLALGNTNNKGTKAAERSRRIRTEEREAAWAVCLDSLTVRSAVSVEWPGLKLDWWGSSRLFCEKSWLEAAHSSVLEINWIYFLFLARKDSEIPGAVWPGRTKCTVKCFSRLMWKGSGDDEDRICFYERHTFMENYRFVNKKSCLCDWNSEGTEELPHSFCFVCKLIQFLIQIWYCFCCGSVWRDKTHLGARRKKGISLTMTNDFFSLSLCSKN